MLWPNIVSTTRLMFQRRYRPSLTQAIVAIIIVVFVLNSYGPSIRDFTGAPQEQDVGIPGPYVGESLLAPKPDPALALSSGGDLNDKPESNLEESFLQEFSRQEITGDPTDAGLETLCNQGSRVWNPNVIIECPLLDGGFGNGRLNLLQCLRYVIEAKVSIKLPRIARRNANDVTDFRTSDHVELDYLIDDRRFLQILGNHCPNLVVHPADYDDARIRRLPIINPLNDLQLESFSEENMPPIFAVPTHPELWPPALDKWLESATEGKPPSAESPVLLGLHSIMFLWPTSHDPPAVVRHFSELVRPRDEVRLLAAAALQRMQQQFNVHIGFRTSDEPRARDNAFVGVHLRVEKDSIDYKWISYEDQFNYLDQRLRERKGNATHPAVKTLPDTEKTVLYVASGDAAGVARFAQDVAPITVVTKNDLLPEGTFAGASLRNMTWDQQALVDMLILEHSGYFIGVRDSTFSWHLALRRAAAVNWITGGYPADCWQGDEGTKERKRIGCRSMLAENEEWRDDLSSLVGNGHYRLEPQVMRTTWP
ncbi:hypothetical protein CSHISOI_05830 [Colletotrichum shisoi]|uniref:Alternative oxidase n=1 Tax=Colletotrichum shisoi TaxID=2078593 RepID=A0A5Q4BRK2_9PEZI|nr:hypothetical protein CSHISOI_05830 [Colletotrichum shisoi]